MRTQSFYLLFFALLLSCASSEYEVARTNPIIRNEIPFVFMENKPDDNCKIIIALIENADVQKLKKILKQNLLTLSERKLQISDLNLLVGAGQQKVFVIRKFQNLDSANYVNNNLPDLSKYSYSSYVVSQYNYRQILRKNGLIEYQDFLNGIGSR